MRMRDEDGHAAARRAPGHLRLRKDPATTAAAPGSPRRSSTPGARPRHAAEIADDTLRVLVGGRIDRGLLAVIDAAFAEHRQAFDGILLDLRAIDTGAHADLDVLLKLDSHYGERHGMIIVAAHPCLLDLGEARRLCPNIIWLD